MRIITGQWKGKILQSDVPQEVRPTTDRVRETMFSILENYKDLTNTSIADICAGTGALGLECLSRYARHCTFFEKSRKVEKILRANMEFFGIEPDMVSIIQGDIRITLPAYTGHTFDVIFTDPPYHEHFINPMMRVIAKKNILRHEGIFIAEHADREVVVGYSDEWHLLTQRVIGDTVLDFFQFVQHDNS